MFAASLLFLQYFFINALLLFNTGNCQILSSWTLNTDTPLPKGGRASLIVGYNAPQRTIWFLGGFHTAGFIGYDDELWSLDISTNTPTWTQWPSLPFEIHAGSQIYTNINNIIYWNLDGDIGTFNMDTQEFQYPSSNIPSLYHNTQSMGMTTDGRYLFAVGGIDWNSYFQIFDTYSTDSEWILGPSLPHGRYRMSMHTSRYHELYVIGGTYPDDDTFLDTIIKINISDIATINSQSWMELTEVLPTASGYHRSVEFADLIYIIGGTAIVNSIRTQINDVVVLDTTSDIILDVQGLNADRSSAASVVALGRIYVFGGYDSTISSTIHSSWEYTNTMPSVSPTPSPTNEPTFSPSLAPSYSPSIAPSSSPTIFVPDWNIVANFSSTFLSIIIDIENDNYASVMLKGSSLVDDCNYIFDDITLELIGSDAICSWVYDEEYNLIINLPSNAKINITNSRNAIIFNPNAFQYFVDRDNYDKLYNSTTKIVIEEIGFPMNIIPPNIMISTSSTIGICDDLILDARGTSNIGGREAKWEWIITGNNKHNGTLQIYQKYGIMDGITNYLVINGSVFDQGVISINLKVTTWANISSSRNIHVYKSDTVAPIIELNGPSIYSSMDNNFQNDIIEISMSLISFDDDCNNDIIDINSIQYGLKWRVNLECIIQIEDCVIDDDKEQSLVQYIETQQTDVDFLKIDAIKYLQAGIQYSFIVFFDCLGQLDCNVSATHILSYQYSDIMCKIYGGDINLFGIDPSKKITLLLDGDLFTIDNDQGILVWFWSFEDTAFDLTFGNDSESITNVEIDKNVLEYDEIYSFEVLMKVQDVKHPFRDPCHDSITINIETIQNINDTEIKFNSLWISINAIQQNINIYDRLRIISSITNYNETNNHHFQYEWTEINGLLSRDEILSFMANSEDAFGSNLIIKENTLKQGLTYQFTLTVNQFDSADTNTLIGYGESGVVSIYILRGPIIIDNTFELMPQCLMNNNSLLFNNISHLLSTSFSLSLTADGDYQPLSYRFTYSMDNDNEHYLHSTLIYSPYLDNIFLPNGNLKIKTTVFDTQSSFAEDEINCKIELKSNDECLQFDVDIFDLIDRFKNQNSIFTELLHKSMVYLIYLQNNQQCLEDNLNVILNILHEIFVGLHSKNQSTILCESNHPILLAQTIMEWIKHLEMIGIESIDQDLDSITKIRNLIYSILDPCLFIKSELFTSLDNAEEYLFISSESILTGTPKVLYRNHNDITNSLSPLLISTSIDYTQLLYDFSTTLIEMITTIRKDEGNIINDGIISIAIDMYHLVEVSLYISELARLSISIPGEETLTNLDLFSIYSIKVDENDIAITIQNVSVFIGGNIIDRGNDLFDSTDILIFGINTTATNVSVSNSNNFINDDCINKDDGYFGEISSESISITIVGNQSLSSNLTSAINFTFPCNEIEGCDIDSYECIWYDQENDIWRPNGCITTIINNGADIQCSCYHLTQFATIHNIRTNNKCSKLNEQILSSPIWTPINIILAILYLILFIYVLIQIFPFFVDPVLKRKTSKTRSFFVMSLICINSLIHIIICIFYVLLRNTTDKVFVTEILSLFILLPFIIYCLIFSAIFYSWYIIYHSMSSDSSQRCERMKKILIALNISVAIFFIILSTTILSMDKDSKSMSLIMTLSSISWSFIITISTTFVCIYLYRVTRILFINVKISQHQSFGDKELSLVRRLAIINSVVTLYLIFKTLIVIYFSIFIDDLNIEIILIELAFNFLCLLLLVSMYRKPMKVFIKTESSSNYINIPIWSSLKRKINSRQRLNATSPSSNTNTNVPDFSITSNVNSNSRNIQMTSNPSNGVVINSEQSSTNISSNKHSIS